MNWEMHLLKEPREKENALKNRQELGNCQDIFSRPTCLVLESQTEKGERIVQKMYLKNTLKIS